MALSLLTLSKDQTCGSKLVDTFKRPEVTLSLLHFQKTRLVALSLLELSKDHTCGSKPVSVIKSPDVAPSLLAL